MKLFAKIACIAAAMFASAPVMAATSVVYNSIPAGQSSFDATLTGAGGTLKTQVLGSSASYTDFSISKAPSSNYSQITGLLADISVPTSNFRSSGVSFTFNTAVNAFGLNVGDWGTCCLPSSLYIAFDGGAPILVGTATSANPAPQTSGSSSIFVGAFNDSGTFSKVEFWGDGAGEYLLAGGTIRYGAVGIGSLPGAVPEPATWAMMLLGFAAVAAAVRGARRRGLALAA